MPPPPPPTNRAASPVKRAETPDKESAGAIFGQKRELDELRIKVRLLESRRAEDQDRIKSMEARAAEADTLRAARVKLQGMSEFEPRAGEVARADD
jgi:dynactin 1